MRKNNFFCWKNMADFRLGNCSSIFCVKVPSNLCGVYASEFMNILNVGIKLEDNRLQIRIDAEGARVAARFTPLNANRPQAYRLTLGTCPVFLPSTFSPSSAEFSYLLERWADSDKVCRYSENSVPVFQVCFC